MAYPGGGGGGGGGFDGPRKRPRFGQQDADEFVPRRRVVGQRPIDYFSSAINHVTTRLYRTDPVAIHVPPHPYYCRSLLPVRETAAEPSTAFCTQWAHTLLLPPLHTKRRVQYCGMHWAPNGRRILHSTTNGEFILYNGHSFAMEARTVAHENNTACKALTWGGINDIIISGDDAGEVKLWKSNFVSLAKFGSGQNAIREIAFAPGERKFVTAGQDGVARVWDTARVGKSGGTVEAETRLEGHGGDVHTIDWHPTKALILTGSQDQTARLWDPRQSGDGHIVTLDGHDKPLTCVRWHPGGQWFLTAARDCTCRLWDVRTMREIAVYQGHTKDVTAVAWHPTHSHVFTSTGLDGTAAFWVVAPGDGTRRPNGTYDVKRWGGAILAAHDEFRGAPNPVADCAWSPMGHVLATAGFEIKFWTRNKPGATEEVRGDAHEAADAMGAGGLGNDGPGGAAGGAAQPNAWMQL